MLAACTGRFWAPGKKKKESSDTSLNCVSNKPEFFDITWKGIIKGLNKKKIKSELTYHILLNYLHELCLRLGLKGKTKKKEKFRRVVAGVNHDNSLFWLN